MPRGPVQGEGDYESARVFNESERRFVESGRVPAAARAAAPRSESERQDMADAEQHGRKRTRGEDPLVARAWAADGESTHRNGKADRQRR
jgi:hypothetical protein